MANDIPAEVAAFARWYKAAYGWNPFEPIECSRCKSPVDLISVYRCYDCHSAMHRDCLIAHCQESRAHA